MIRRILIVGHGSIGSRHLRIVRSSLPDADIRVLRHQPCSKVPEFADGCFSSIGEALAFSPEIAILANPAIFHMEIATPLAEIGCHLLIEKPISDRPDDVPALIATANARNAIVQVGYNLRFIPSLVFFRELVHARHIGRVLSIRCEVGQYLPSWRPGTDYRTGVSARSELGGGVLLELSHELDYLRWIFGNVLWLSAWVGKQSSLEIDVEDTAHLILAHVGFEPDERPITNLSMDFIRHDTTRRCLAIGENGSLRWDATTGKVEFFSAGGSKWSTLFECHLQDRDESYRLQWEHFYGCATQIQSPLVNGGDGLETLKLVSSAQQSSEMGGARIYISELEQ